MIAVDRTSRMILDSLLHLLDNEPPQDAEQHPSLALQEQVGDEWARWSAQVGAYRLILGVRLVNEAIAAAQRIARGESAVHTQYIAPNRPNPQSIELLAEITADLDAVDARWNGYVGTHYEACWKHHAQCLAARLRARIEDNEDDAVAIDGHVFTGVTIMNQKDPT